MHLLYIFFSFLSYHFYLLLLLPTKLLYFCLLTTDINTVILRTDSLAYGSVLVNVHLTAFHLGVAPCAHNTVLV